MIFSRMVVGPGMIHEQSDRQSRNAKDAVSQESGLCEGGLRMRRNLARDLARRSESAPAASLLAIALGAAAVGAVAIGALAIGRLAIGRMTVKKARFGALEVDELTVRRLRVLENE